MYETQRIKIVPFSEHYFKRLFELFCENETVMKSTLKGRVYTLKEFLTLLAKQFVLSSDDKSGFLCLLSKESNALIGITGLLPCHYTEQESYEFGFILNHNYWGKGMATELGEFWLRHAKDVLKLPCIMATVSPDNKVSQKVMKKLGMELKQELVIEDRGKRLLFVKEFYRNTKSIANGDS